MSPVSGRVEVLRGSGAAAGCRRARLAPPKGQARLHGVRAHVRGARVADQPLADAWSSGCRSGRPPRTRGAVGAHGERARLVAEEGDHASAASRRAPLPRLVASKTHTSARPVPGDVVVAVRVAGVFWPRWAVVMNARLPPGRRRRCRSARRRRAACASRAASPAHVDDADAVGEMVDDPDLGVRARGDRHRLHADLHRCRCG